jgi:hypothetical protein
VELTIPFFFILTQTLIYIELFAFGMRYSTSNPLAFAATEVGLSNSFLKIALFQASHIFQHKNLGKANHIVLKTGLSLKFPYIICSIEKTCFSRNLAFSFYDLV